MESSNVFLWVLGESFLMSVFLVACLSEIKQPPKKRHILKFAPPIFSEKSLAIGPMAFGSFLLRIAEYTDSGFF